MPLRSRQHALTAHDWLGRLPNQERSGRRWLAQYPSADAGGWPVTRWIRFRGWRSPAVAVALAAGCLVAVPAASHAAPLTVVTIQFDDGNADAFLWTSSVNNHGFPATYY